MDASHAGTAYVDFDADFSSLNRRVAAAIGPLTSRFGKLGAAGAAGLGVVSGAAVGAGVALYNIGEQFDNSYDTISQRTGATGKRLGVLKADFKAVVSDVPADFDTAGNAVAGLNQRLGLTGKPLQRLAKQISEFSRMTETDVNTNIETTSRLFKDWSIDTGDQSKTLDQLFRTTQETGIGLDTLSSLMVQFGSPLRQLGLDFDYASAMFSTFEKEGVNMQTLMPGLRFALKNFSGSSEETMATFKKWGLNLKDPSEALQQVFTMLREAPSDLKANAIAFEVFGTRAGPDMAAAVREGRFNVGELMKEIANGNDTILKASERTADFSERWQVFKNRVMVELEPAARKLFDVIGDGMRDVGDVITDPRLSAEEKLTTLFDMAADEAEDGLDLLADKVGDIAPEVAERFVMSFVNADAWGKLLIAGVVLPKLLRLKGAMRTAGFTLGESAASGIATGTGAGMDPTKGRLRSRFVSWGKSLGFAMGAAGVVGGLTTALTEDKGADGIGDALHNAGVGFFRTFGVDIGHTTAEEFSAGFKERIESLASTGGIGLQSIIPPEVEQKAKESAEAILKARNPGDWGELEEVGYSPEDLPDWESVYLREFSDLMRTVDASRASAKQLFSDFWDDMNPDERAFAKALRRSLVQGDRLLKRTGVKLPAVSFETNPEQTAKAARQLVGGFDFLRKGIGTDMADINRVVRRNFRLARVAAAGDSGTLRKLTATNFRAAAKAIEQQMDRSGHVTKAGMKRVRELIRNANLIDPSRKQAQAFGREWAKGMDTSKETTKRGMREMLHEAEKMPAPMRRLAVQSWLGQIKEAKRAGDLTANEFRDMRSRVLSEWPAMQRGTKTKSKDMADGVIGNIGRMVNSSADVLEVFRDNVNHALKKYGVEIQEFAIEHVSVPAGGEVKRQQGGIVPGSGSGDRPGFFGEVGAFVLNREATRSFGFNKGGIVPLALEPGERYFTASEVDRIGLSRLEWMNSAVPRQKGGGIGIGPMPTMTGPDPMRALGQEAIRSVYEGGKDFLAKQAPIGGPGYSGPPIGPKGTSAYKGVLLATWVREALEYAAAHGSGDPQPTSGYRSHAQNVAEGRNYFSEHEKTQYPGGAVDFGGYTTGYAAKMAVVNATKNFKYPLLAPIGFEDDGHASGTGHQFGGLVQALIDGGFVDATQTQKNVALAIGRNLLPRGLNYKGAAGIIGNAWRESKWAPGAEGTGGGGLYGFTYGDISLASLKAEAERQGRPWTDIDFQNDFMWSGPEPGKKLLGALNSQPNAAAAAEYFDTYWEKSGVKAMSERKDGAREAMRLMTGSDMEGGAGAEEEVPATYEGARTGSLSFPPVPKNLPAIEREIKRWEAERRTYRVAKRKAEKKGRPAVAQAIGKNLTEIENHLRQLYNARTQLRTEKAKKKFSSKLSAKLGQFAEYEVEIDGIGRDFRMASEEAERIVSLEPEPPELPASATDAEREKADKDFVERFTKYVNEEEGGVYSKLLGIGANWRNQILRAEFFGWPAQGGKGGKPSVAKVSGNWEKKVREIVNQIDYIHDFADQTRKLLNDFKADHPDTKPEDYPKWLKERIAKRDRLNDKLPFLKFQDRELRTNLGEARGFFFPGGKNRLKPPDLPLEGTGSLEDKLIEVQGTHWPDFHSLLPVEAFLPPRTKTGVSGAIGGVQEAMEDLGVKTRQAANGLGGGEDSGDQGEHEALLRELLTQANQEKIIRQLEEGILGPGLPPYAGKAHTGAIVSGPAGAERTMIVQSGEGIFTKDQMAALGAPAQPIVQAPNLKVIVYGEAEIEAEIDDKRIEAVVERRERKQARSAVRPRAGSQGRPR